MATDELNENSIWIESPPEYKLNWSAIDHIAISFWKIRIRIVKFVIIPELLRRFFRK